MIVPVDEFSSLVMADSLVLRPYLSKVTCVAGAGPERREKAVALVAGKLASLAELQDRLVLNYLEFVPRVRPGLQGLDPAEDSAVIGFLCWQHEMDVQKLFEVLPRFEPGITHWHLQLERDFDLFVLGLGFQPATGPMPGLNWRDPAAVERQLRAQGLWTDLGVSMVKIVDMAPGFGRAPPLPPPSLPPVPSFVPPPLPPLSPPLPLVVPPVILASPGLECAFDLAGVESVVRFFSRPDDKQVWDRVAPLVAQAIKTQGPELCAWIADGFPRILKEKFTPLQLLAGDDKSLLVRVISLARARPEVLRISTNTDVRQEAVRQRATELGLTPQTVDTLRFGLASRNMKTGRSFELVDMEDFAHTLQSALTRARFDRESELRLAAGLNALLTRFAQVCFTHGDLRLQTVVLRDDGRLEVIGLDRSSFEVCDTRGDVSSLTQSLHQLWTDQRRDPDAVFLERMLRGLTQA